PASQNIFRSVNSIKFSSKILNDVVKEFELEKNVEDTSRQINKIDFRNKIQLIDVSFSYKNSGTKEVLKNFNLELSKNSSLGIVGKSGSGKSTLMDIMLGLLTPTSGSIRIDDIELNKDTMRSWQNIVSYVPQYIYLADTSIAENI